ncbi:MAG: hypothetical protein HKO02_07475 [Hyphomonadaceae bacterium]|nr:hypothetical protein [Hyphomonadaceae bacterium]
MKKKNVMISKLMLGAAGLALAACGGSSSSTPPPSTTTPPPPVAKSGTVTGSISGFGSVIVNGDRYATNGASFDIDGKTGSQSDLKVGQIVTMKTSTDAQGNKSASSVSFKDAVQGEITAISLTPKRITVMGQNVVIRGSTSFDDDIDPNDINGLTVGDIVQVSGQFNGSGNIVASQIEFADAADAFELTGNVSALDPVAMTFKIRGLDVDYSGATLEDFDGADIANGDLVEVKGDSFDGSGAFLALSVEKEDKEDDGEDGEDGEVEGFITEFTSAQSFTVGDTPVITDESTVFEYCTADDLGVDVEVEVEGEFNAEGALVADKVECEFDADIHVESTLDAVDAGTGVITIFGVEFATDMSTRFEDKLETPVEMFGIDDLVAGNYLDVKGFERADGTLYAKKIERDEAEDEDEIQDYVDSVDPMAKSLVLLGVTVLTDERTEYEGADDMPLTGDEFFSMVMPEDLVKAEGTKTEAGELLASEIEFETPDDE